jgi:hypothetical protein
MIYAPYRSHASNVHIPAGEARVEVSPDWGLSDRPVRTHRPQSKPKGFPVFDFRRLMKVFGK